MTISVCPFVSQRWKSLTSKRSEFLQAGIDDVFVRDNCFHSVRGALRGLHYQKAPRAQGKLVSVITGEIFDVAGAWFTPWDTPHEGAREIYQGLLQKVVDPDDPRTITVSWYTRLLEAKSSA